MPAAYSLAYYPIGSAPWGPPPISNSLGLIVVTSSEKSLVFRYLYLLKAKGLYVNDVILAINKSRSKTPSSYLLSAKPITFLSHSNTWSGVNRAEDLVTNI